MKRAQLSIPIMLIFLFYLWSGCSKNPQKPDEGGEPNLDIPGWELVWHDEFNSTTIDLSKWEHEVNGWGGGNNELQYYTARPVNSFIQDGKLIIQALKETYTGPDGTRQYTSARLRTLNKGDWLYGRFDILARLPEGQGLWPAIWLLPTDWVYGGWAASGEIDIMELLGHQPRTVYGTLHYGGEFPANVHTGSSFTLANSEPSFSEDFHLFTLEWDTTEFRWYVDGTLYQIQTEWYTTNAPYPAPFDQRFHMILNVAVGGNWPGNPDSTTLFPQTMEVEYVRVYKKAEN
ncbi:MAG: glycoside hydrolase family 16 protein [Calditrichaeota bacterium]|nr:MAG: glycoside hydrolase family 16 protein [Calditrichota bacterium]